MGEGLAGEELIMPWIHAANISCGWHAGDAQQIYDTMLLARKHKVRVGAHPSYNDRAHFGRVEHHLSPKDLHHLIIGQLREFDIYARAASVTWEYVKPHGALYNLSARDEEIAKGIARAVYDFNPSLGLVGLAGSFSISAARALGITVYEEGFADRTYEPDGSLVPRSHPRAVITDAGQAVKQVLDMQQGFVQTIDGGQVNLQVDTICVHGDSPGAYMLVKAIRQILNPHL